MSDSDPKHRAEALKPLWAELAADAWHDCDRQRFLANSALYDVATTASDKTRLAEALRTCRMLDAAGPEGARKFEHRKGPDGKRHWERRL